MNAIIRKVREPFGILGNMSQHPVEFEGLKYHTTEALFQALRFPVGSEIRELIRQEKNPMKAKMLAKSHTELMIVEQLSQQDLDNMRFVLRTKLDAHESVRKVLASTGQDLIVEDCSNRPHGSGLFWGAQLVEGSWNGLNWLGKLWMELRQSAFEG